MPSLGLVMILRNEEENLLRSLKPVAHLFDEVVVVDTGSADSTVKIARSLGARVHEIKWNNDFAAARNYSISKAKADYLFWLDGDNAISPQDVARLRKFLETETGEFIGWGREILVPRGGSLIQKRLFPRRPDVFFRGRIHEQLSHPDWFRFVYLGVDILHWGYQDPAAAKAKGLRNLELLTEELEAAPGDFFLLYQKGKTLFNLRRYPEALESLSRALEIDPDSTQNPELQAHARILLGLARERTGDDQAAVLFEKAAESFPLARKIALFHLGRIKARESDPRAAMESLGLFLNEPDQHLTLGPGHAQDELPGPDAAGPAPPRPGRARRRPGLSGTGRGRRAGEPPASPRAGQGTHGAWPPGPGPPGPVRVGPDESQRQGPGRVKAVDRLGKPWAWARRSWDQARPFSGQSYQANYSLSPGHRSRARRQGRGQRAERGKICFLSTRSQGIFLGGAGAGGLVSANPSLFGMLVA